MNMAKLLTLFIIVFFVWSRNVVDLSEAKRTDQISAKEEAGQIIDTFISEKGLAVQKNTKEYQELMKSILLGDYPELTGEGSKYINGQQELDLILEYATKQMSPLFKDYPVESEVQEAISPNVGATLAVALRLPSLAP